MHAHTSHAHVSHIPYAHIIHARTHIICFILLTFFSNRRGLRSCRQGAGGSSCRGTGFLGGVISPCLEAVDNSCRGAILPLLVEVENGTFDFADVAAVEESFDDAAAVEGSFDGSRYLDGILSFFTAIKINMIMYVISYYNIMICTIL